MTLRSVILLQKELPCLKQQAAQVMYFHFNLVFACRTDHRTETWPAAAAQITGMASGGSMDHRSLSRRLNPENALFILDILCRVKVILQLGTRFFPGQGELREASPPLIRGRGNGGRNL